MRNCWSRHRKLLVCAVLLLATATLYWPVVSFDFVDYDDLTYIVRNAHVNTGFHWGQLAWPFESGFGGNWQPLTWWSHALDFQLYGLWAGGHHTTNIMLQALSAMALFLLLQRWTKAFWRSALVAALWAWHPLHVESVAWVSERKDCLSCLLWVLTLWAYLQYAEELKVQSSTRCARAQARREFKIFYGLSLVFFGLGLMAKPMVVTLPFVLLLLDYWPLGRVPSQSPRALLKEKIPFFLLSAACCIVTLIMQTRSGAIVPLAGIPLDFRFWNAAASYVWYIEKAFWPKDLIVMYPLARLSSWLVTLSIVILISISGLAVLWRRTRPYFLFGWCWFLGTLVPVIGLIQVGTQSTADRYSYIPTMGLFIMLVWGVNELAARWPHQRVALGVLAAAVAMACIVATRLQLACWKDTAALFAHALKVMPNNAPVRALLASYYRDQGQLEQARLECEWALRDAPGNPVMQHDLGQILLAEKKFDQAADQFRLSLQSLPNQEGTRMNLGKILLAQNKAGEAVAEFQTALRYNPRSENIHFHLAEALGRQGNIEEAAEEFAQCIRLQPSEAEPHARLAALLSSQGRTAEAIAEYREALRLQPDSPDLLNNLAWILAADAHAPWRNGQEAQRLAERACELTHYSRPLLIGTLAVAYAEAGRFDEAIAAAQKAHDLALAMGKNDMAARNLELLELFRAHRPFHENP
jgi:protein O-mannosyl-transferase